ncbi:MAG TPA: hypothetical protein VFO11_03260, partial [Candidatus Polarisedimenticolaceae bacterium]|nr:hypothetical protein [Candidatus Polarisedimenticolaceae bacterium]
LGGGLQSSGAVAPGLSPGILTVDGSYTQHAGGSLEIEIGGLSSGTEHDQLEVVGATTLTGALSVSLLDGFVPQDGHTFTILTAAEIHGSFSTRSLPPLPAGLGWSVLLQPTAVVLAVSPDSDGDGVGDIGDCAPADPSAHDTPGEVAGLAFGADKETLSWTSQAAWAGGGTVYDVVRGLTSALPVGGAGETCLLSASATPQVVDQDLPEVGTSFYYLVRATNACGVGSYGTSTSGAPRMTGACP